jgi:hypothetical protein
MHAEVIASKRREARGLLRGMIEPLSLGLGNGIRGNGMKASNFKIQA